MKGNTFQMWLKEFCALVFTQTIQAFLMAIILILVVIILNVDSTGDNSTSNQAAGILAIIALSSISKIEGLVKKMFGVDSSFTDTSMQGGKSGILGTMMAFNLAKRALDNGSKVVSGAKSKATAINDKRKATLAYVSGIQKLNSRVSSNVGKSNVKGTASGTASNSSEEESTLKQGAAEVKAALNQGASGGRIGSGNITITNSNVKMSGNALSGKSSDDYNDKFDKLKSDYKSKLDAAKEKSKQGTKDIVTGITETAGATIGGFTGGVTALAAGGSVLKGIGDGMGIGDAAGQFATDVAFGTKETLAAAKEYREAGKQIKSIKRSILAKARNNPNLRVDDI